VPLWLPFQYHVVDIIVVVFVVVRLVVVVVRNASTRISISRLALLYRGHHGTVLASCKLDTIFLIIIIMK
jgi:hypothetical protein